MSATDSAEIAAEAATRLIDDGDEVEVADAAKDPSGDRLLHPATNGQDSNGSSDRVSVKENDGRNAERDDEAKRDDRGKNADEEIDSSNVRKVSSSDESDSNDDGTTAPYSRGSASNVRGGHDDSNCQRAVSGSDGEIGSDKRKQRNGTKKDKEPKDRDSLLADHGINDGKGQNSFDEVNCNEQGEFVPPEGGWGWLVCLASFWTNGTLFGILNVFGILYVEFLEEFKDQGEEIYFKLCEYGKIIEITGSIGS